MKSTDLVGVVESTGDPAGQGRLKVRVFDFHEPDPTILPTGDLPWASVIMPTNITGGGTSSFAIPIGTWVTGFFRDPGDYQDFVVTGQYGTGNNIGAMLGGQMSYNMGYGAASAYGNPVCPPWNKSPFLGPGGPPEGLTDRTATTKHIPVALSQEGTLEGYRNTGVVEKYFGPWSGGIQHGAPYCAAFVAWSLYNSGALPLELCPKTALVKDMVSWAERSPYAKRVPVSQAQYGDIGAHQTCHAFMFTSGIDRQGMFTTIEGNTHKPGGGPEGVWQKRHGAGYASFVYRILAPATA